MYLENLLFELQFQSPLNEIQDLYVEVSGALQLNLKVEYYWKDR